jgi:hypothetical protein
MSLVTSAINGIRKTIPMIKLGVLSRKWVDVILIRLAKLMKPKQINIPNNNEKIIGEMVGNKVVVFSLIVVLGR